MKKGNIKAIIFDLEGTLLTSKIDFAKMRKKMTEVLVSHGFKEGSLPYILITNNKKFNSILKEKGISESKISKIIEEIADIINDVEMENIEESVEISGATRTLRELKARNLKVGIVTRNSRVSAISALRITDLLKFIDILVARDDCENPKPEPEHLLKALKILNVEPKEAVMVGDGGLDALCAINAKVKFIGVLTGYFSQEKFKEMKVEFLPSVQYLIRLLE